MSCQRYDGMIDGRSLRRVLVVGASDAGTSLIRRIDHQPGLGMRVVGVLDPDRQTWGRMMEGVRVLGPPAEVRRQVDLHEVDLVLASIPIITASAVRDLVTACTGTRAKVQVVPELDSELSSSLAVQPRDVEITDLLCREPVRLDNHSVDELLRGRVILVTGAAGSIGSEICRQVLAFRPLRLILLDQWENGLFFLERELLSVANGVEIISRVASITDAARLRGILGQFHPALVLHSAAHKHVPMMEANPGEAVKNNVLGTRTLVDEAVRAGVEAFVMTSTDKAVNPTSVMGACKRVAEMYVQALSARALGTRLVVVRFGNVLGSSGSVVPLFREQIRRGGPVTVTDPDMTRYFMTIPQATQLVLQAGALGRGGEIFVLDMGEPVRVLDLASDLIRLSGLTEGRDVEIVFTGPRPGEKLHEELYNDGEERFPTSHPRIFQTRNRQYPAARLWDELEQLARIADGPDDGVRAALKRLVPQYRPSSLVTTSEYEDSVMAISASPSDDSGETPGGKQSAAQEAVVAHEGAEPAAELGELIGVPPKIGDTSSRPSRIERITRVEGATGDDSSKKIDRVFQPDMARESG
jgi:FlaA1/EpsC-like NDP-sugar epimerase